MGVTLDGNSAPDDLLREHLLKARDIARKGHNAVLVYILEMALKEFDENGLSNVPMHFSRDVGAA